MAEVAGDQLEVVVKGRRRDLQVGVWKDIPGSLQFGSDLPEDPSNGEVKGEDRNGRKDAFFDVGQVALLSRRAVGPLEEFPDGHSARELGVARDRLDPIEIESKWTRA